MPEYDKLGDIRSEWWLAVEVYSCLACDALVTDKAKHDYWHERADNHYHEPVRLR